ncbi:MAG: hypothetical protein QOH83_2155 [Solirubrobacteraceae bacterium]|nr:hypothetical protein [Solirubrobacteraceae bacterium]
MIVILLFTFALLVSALLVGWLLVVSGIVRHPILIVPIAVYLGLVLWLGAHDAQALTAYAAVALVIWRLMHKSSFERFVGRRLRPLLPGGHGPGDPGYGRQAVPPHPKDLWFVPIHQRRRRPRSGTRDGPARAARRCEGALNFVSALLRPGVRDARCAEWLDDIETARERGRPIYRRTLWIIVRALPPEVWRSRMASRRSRRTRRKA